MADDIPHTHRGFGRQSIPYGKTLAFYRRVLAEHGKPFCDSWLNDKNCDFTDDTVYTTGIGNERLKARCAAFAEECGVTIQECVAVRERFTGVRPQKHDVIGQCSEAQRQYFVHARIKLGIKNHFETNRRFKVDRIDPRLLHTTPELAERLNAPPLSKLLTMYGVRVSGDIADA